MDEEDPVALAATYRVPLSMVREFHARGFERLRAYPTLSPSGMYWRCSVGPSRVAQPGNGALIDYELFNSPLVAHYSSGGGSEYFGIDGAGLTPRELADRFAERHSQILEAAQGADGLYVVWYSKLLELTEPNLFPYAMADFEIPEDRLPCLTIGLGVRDVELSLPPRALDVTNWSGPGQGL